MIESIKDSSNETYLGHLVVAGRWLLRHGYSLSKLPIPPDVVATYMIMKLKDGAGADYLRGIAASVRWWHHIFGFEFDSNHYLIKRVKQNAITASKIKTNLGKVYLPFTRKQFTWLWNTMRKTNNYAKNLCVTAYMLCVISGLRGSSVWYSTGVSGTGVRWSKGLKDKQIEMIFKYPNQEHRYVSIRMVKWLDIDTTVGIRIKFTGEQIKNVKKDAIIYKYIGRTRNPDFDPVLSLLKHLRYMFLSHPDPLDKGLDQYTIRKSPKQVINLEAARKWLIIYKPHVPDARYFGKYYHIHSARNTFADRMWKIGFSDTLIGAYGGWTVRNSLRYYVCFDISVALSLADRIINEKAMQDKQGKSFNVKKVFNDG